MSKYEVMSHIFPKIFFLCVLIITIVSSNINEVIKTVLNSLFFYEEISQLQKSAKRLQANKNKKIRLKII